MGGVWESVLNNNNNNKTTNSSDDFDEQPGLASTGLENRNSWNSKESSWSLVEGFLGESSYLYAFTISVQEGGGKGPEAFLSILHLFQQEKEHEKIGRN